MPINRMMSGSLLLLAMIASFTVVVVSKGKTVIPVVTFGLIGAVLGLSRITLIPLHRVITGYIFLMLLLDMPSAVAYYDITPITELLGGILLYDSLGNTLGIPGLSIYPIDLISIALFFIALFSYWPELESFGLSAPEKQLVFRASMIFLLSIIPGIVWGIAQGHDGLLMLYQVRFLIYPFFWLNIGFLAFYRLEQAMDLLNTLTLAMIVKAIIGIYIYWMYLRYDPSIQFIVDHHTSIYWCVAIVYVFVRCFLWTPNWRLKTFGILLIALMGYPMVLNDRRTAFLGLAINFIFMLISLRTEQLKRLIKILAFGFPVYLVFLVNNWIANDDGNVIDYRDLENFNILGLVNQNPWIGYGFGKRFESIAPMPDITTIYPLFDLNPHNTMLSLWGYGGPLPMAALAAIFTMGFVSYLYLTKFTENRHAQIFGIAALATSVQFLLFAFADIGMIEPRSLTLTMVFTGMSIGFYFRLQKRDEA